MPSVESIDEAGLMRLEGRGICVPGLLQVIDRSASQRIK
jgi:hypothetical protein